MRPLKRLFVLATLAAFFLACTPLQALGEGEESSFQFQAEVSR